MLQVSETVTTIERQLAKNYTDPMNDIKAEVRALVDWETDAWNKRDAEA